MQSIVSIHSPPSIPPQVVMVDNDIKEIHKIPVDDSDLPDASISMAASKMTRTNSSHNRIAASCNIVPETMVNVHEELTTERAVATEVAASLAKKPSPALDPLALDASDMDMARASTRLYQFFHSVPHWIIKFGSAFDIYIRFHM